MRRWSGFLVSAMLLVILASSVALSASAQEAEPIEILWVADERSFPHSSYLDNVARQLENRTDRSVEIVVVEVPLGSMEAFYITVREEIWKRGIDLIFGITQSEVRFLAANGLLQDVSLEELESPWSRSLFMTSAGESKGDWSSGLDRVIAVPLEISIPMICFSRREGHLNFLAEMSPSIFEIAYGKLSNRLAPPDPRFDSAGRAFLLSIFRSAGGVHGG